MITVRIAMESGIKIFIYDYFKLYYLKSTRVTVLSATVIEEDM